MLPLEKGGEFARGLEAGRAAALAWREALLADGWRTAMPPELDILLFASAEMDSEAISRRSQEIFRRTAENGLHLAVARLPRELLQPWWPAIEWRREEAVVLRSCLRKPVHAREWREIHERLRASL